MGAKTVQVSGSELFVKAFDAVFQPGIGDAQAQVTQANVEQLLGWQALPIDGHDACSLKDLSPQDNKCPTPFRALTTGDDLHWHARNRLMWRG